MQFKIEAPDYLSMPITRWIMLNNQRVIDKMTISIEPGLIKLFQNEVTRYVNKPIKSYMKSDTIIFEEINEQEGQGKTKQRARKKKNSSNDYGQ